MPTIVAGAVFSLGVAVFLSLFLAQTRSTPDDGETVVGVQRNGRTMFVPRRILDELEHPRRDPADRQFVSRLQGLILAALLGSIVIAGIIRLA
jgi:hypothetical protein